MRLGFTASLTSIPAVSTVVGRVIPFGVTAVRLISTVNCWISIGKEPTAAVGGANSTLIVPAAGGDIFTIADGESVAVIVSSAGGTFNLTELTN